MNNARKLFYNTLLLTASAFIMHTVLVSFNVYLSNKIGASGIGLFQLITAVYGMAVTFSVAGCRLASMRLVSDSLALGHANQRYIMKIVLSYAVTCGVITGLILVFFSDLICCKWIGDTAAAAPLRILSTSLPFVSASAAFNGYFTSEKKVLRYTFIQLAEQFVRIGASVMLLNRVKISDPGLYCKAIAAGISLSEIISFICSFTVFRLSSKNEKEKHKNGVLRGLMRIAIPDAFGSEIRSILTTTQHLLIPKGLKKHGDSGGNALATYGIIHGMSLPVLLYPSALLSSLSGLLIPEISSHYISGNKKRINYMIHRVLHISLLFSIGTGGIMYFTADKLSEVFYDSSEPGFYIRIIAPLIPVMYCDMSVDGMLKGLDQQVQYMKYNVIDAASCVIMAYFLVPVMGAKGYIFMIFFSEILNLFLSIRRLSKVSDVEIDFMKDIIAPAVCIFISCLSISLFENIFSFNKPGVLSCFLTVLFCIVLYVLLLRVSDSIDKDELNWIKGLIKQRNNKSEIFYK